ncbi:UNVERIFIED_CONTAM: dcaf8 [Trichonephila clavipes]
MESTSSSSSKRSTKNEGHESNDSGSKSDGNYSNDEPIKGKRLKKDDSGINVIPESDNSDGSDFADSSVNLDQQNEAPRYLTDDSERDSADSGNLGSFSMNEFDQGDTEESAVNNMENGEGSSGVIRNEPRRPRFLNSSDEDSGEDIADVKTVNPKKDEPNNYDPTPNTPRPKHNWIAAKAIASRQLGFSSKYSPDLFRYDCYGALHFVERLELMYKMKKHDGCVNALNFNSTGTRLVSGSDDLHVIIWDWTVSEPVLEYRSGHQANVFQVSNSE